MKKNLPEQYRVGPPAFHCRPGAGAFRIPHPKISNYHFFCIVSSGAGWEHVSISMTKVVPVSKLVTVERCPTWEEMCWIKDRFWNEEECVVQYHPPKSEYVSNHPWCLHLWKPTAVEMPRPDPTMVGIVKG